MAYHSMHNELRGLYHVIRIYCIKKYLWIPEPALRRYSCNFVHAICRTD